MNPFLKWLELRIPPVGVALLLMVLMKFASGLGAPLVPDPDLADLIGWFLMILGLVPAIAGVASFRRHQTTVDPRHPESAEALVESGIYRFSRNPMYLGFSVLLLGVAFKFNSWAAVPGPLALAFWLHRFQIRPEERFLRERFGEAFDAYCRRVPRWIGWPSSRPSGH